MAREIGSTGRKAPHASPRYPALASAAEDGDTDAAYEYAQKLEEQHEDAEAERWYRDAAENGDIPAMVGPAALR